MQHAILDLITLPKSEISKAKDIISHTISHVHTTYMSNHVCMFDNVSIYTHIERFHNIEIHVHLIL